MFQILKNTLYRQAAEITANVVVVVIIIPAFYCNRSLDGSTSHLRFLCLGDIHFGPKFNGVRVLKFSWYSCFL